MPWSDWQTPWSWDGAVDQVIVTRKQTPSGTDPAYDGVTISKPSWYSTPVYLDCTKQTQTSYNPAYTQQSAMQVSVQADWQTDRQWTPPALNDLHMGLDYGVRPDRLPTDPDAFIQYESGINTLSWSFFDVSVNYNNGAPAGSFRMRAVVNQPLGLDPSTTAYPPSAWPTDSGAVVISGTAAQTSGYLGRFYLPDLAATSFLIWPESDSIAYSFLRLAVSPGYPRPKLTSPRWRYWIPDQIPSHPYIAPTHNIRVMSVDCSGDQPKVLSNKKIPSDFLFDSTSATLFTLRVPELSINALASPTYYNAPSVRNALLVFDDDGNLLSQTTFHESATGHPSPIGLYGNPQDPTECAAVLQDGTICVISHLDTTPAHTRTIFMNSSAVSYMDWPVFGSNPYLVGPGLLDLPVPKAGMPDIPLYARNYHSLKMTEIGRDTIEKWDPAGVAEMGQRLVWASIGELSTYEDYEERPAVYITDYRDPSKPVTTKQFLLPRQGVVPKWEPPNTIDYLSAGSFTLAASDQFGRVVHGYLVLSDDPDDTTTVPGVTVYTPGRYTALVSVIDGEPGPNPPRDESIIGLPTDLMRTFVDIPVTWEGFYRTSQSDMSLDQEIVPDATHLVVGNSPVLTSDDQATYLEHQFVTADPNGLVDYFAVKIGPLQAPEGSMIEQLNVEAGFWTDRRLTDGYDQFSGFVLGLNEDDTIHVPEFNQTLSYGGQLADENIGKWQHQTLNAYWSPHLESFLAAGRLVLMFNTGPWTNNNNLGTWTQRLSYMKITAQMATRSPAT